MSSSLLAVKCSEVLMIQDGQPTLQENYLKSVSLLVTLVSNQRYTFGLKQADTSPFLVRKTALPLTFPQDSKEPVFLNDIISQIPSKVGGAYSNKCTYHLFGVFFSFLFSQLKIVDIDQCQFDWGTTANLFETMKKVDCTSC